ncbi:MAG TPA: hypothetical protein VES95_10470 [Dermatophilaceae bacterium]|nr:hypothetical protein [Dermatophilaceae bacterium]
MNARRATRPTALLLGAAAGLIAVAGAAGATPPPGGVCPGQFVPSTSVTNPADPGFFATIDKNGDGVVCVKDWTGPDPDPEVGFLVIDNVAQHNRT